MSVRSVYLDTNAIVKRYVVEEHTDQIDAFLTYDKKLAQVARIEGLNVIA